MTIFKKLKAWLYNNWNLCLICLGFIPIALRFFLRFSSLAMLIAAVPIDKYIVTPLVEKMGMGEVTARIISFITTGMLMLIGWHIAEVVVLLIAIAFTAELITLIKIINEKYFVKALDSIESNA